MLPLFTPSQVRAFDERTIAGGTSVTELMERAAGHLARAVVALAGRSYGLRVALLCGRGNNGGDGIAAGRRLLDLGAAPVVALVAGEEGLGPEGVAQLRRYRAAGGRLVPVDAALAHADLAVDCLLGTGAAGAPRPPFDAAVDALNHFPGPVIACDLPTGVDADTGQVPAQAVRADLTVTLGARKRGLALWPARGHVGRELLAEIGITVPSDPPVAQVLEHADVAEFVPSPPPVGDKRTRGVVVALAGAPGMAGAAVLVARGAMAAGAGLVTIATGNPDLVTASVPEALTAAVTPDDAFSVLQGALRGATALAVGPGLGHADPIKTLVRRIVREIDLPLVLDADALNVFRGDGDALADHAAPLLVLTPHEREFARLVEGEGEIWPQRYRLAPERAEAWNAVIVAKGPGTIVAAPDGRVWINPFAGAALAHGGTGDVLTGITATLVGQRAVPESVAAAVYLHALAGELAAARGHARSVTALEVAAALPDALRTMSTGPMQSL